jgi:hypothetical protein
MSPYKTGLWPQILVDLQPPFCLAMLVTERPAPVLFGAFWSLATPSLRPKCAQAVACDVEVYLTAAKQPCGGCATMQLQGDWWRPAWEHGVMNNSHA